MTRLRKASRDPSASDNLIYFHVCRFACIIIVYLIVGILVMKFVKGASGKDVVPNVGFWSDFPFLVKVRSTIQAFITNGV